jgi:hypothetical protein
MTRPPSPSTSRDGAGAALAAALALAAILLAPRAAAAQACCVGTGLVTPARLRMFENHAVGVQTRFRSVMGSLSATGDYVPAPTGDDELDAEQDLFAATRFGAHFQAALQVPFVETGRRTATTGSAWGGGLGDVSVNARYDVVANGEGSRWPGIAVLGGITAPTGRAVGQQASDPLATSTTGTGSFDGNLGLAVEQIIGQGFASVTGWAAPGWSSNTHRFRPRLTGLLAGGYTFHGDRTLGAYLLASRQSQARDAAGAPITDSQVVLMTAGVAGAVPLGEQQWRLQGAAFADLPAWGRNQSTGVGLTLALLRLWL